MRYKVRKKGKIKGKTETEDEHKVYRNENMKAGLPNQGMPLGGLSRVMGNYHSRFLGGLGLATVPGCPTAQRGKER